MNETIVATHSAQNNMGQAEKALDLSKLAQGEPANVAIICGTLLAIVLVSTGYEFGFSREGGKLSVKFGARVCSGHGAA